MSRPGRVKSVAATMIGRRRPKGVERRSERAPMMGGMAIANRPPTLTARPIAVPWLALGTTASIWFWMTTVVRGCHMKKLPNQKALRAACLRFPKRPDGAATATAVFIGERLEEVAYMWLLRTFRRRPETS